MVTLVICFQSLWVRVASISHLEWLFDCLSNTFWWGINPCLIWSSCCSATSSRGSAILFGKVFARNHPILYRNYDEENKKNCFKMRRTSSYYQHAVAVALSRADVVVVVKNFSWHHYLAKCVRTYLWMTTSSLDLPLSRSNNVRIVSPPPTIVSELRSVVHLPDNATSSFPFGPPLHYEFTTSRSRRRQLARRPNSKRFLVLPRRISAK